MPIDDGPAKRGAAGRRRQCQAIALSAHAGDRMTSFAELKIDEEDRHECASIDQNDTPGISCDSFDVSRVRIESKRRGSDLRGGNSDRHGALFERFQTLAGRPVGRGNNGISCWTDLLGQ